MLMHLGLFFLRSEIMNKKKELMLKIKRSIHQKGWNQTMLAEYLGVYKSTISSWLNGRREPNLDSLIAIEEALDVELLNTK
jgi:transcriptional regulator with XRE-family HTH domain